jgi:hypothetical protein
MANNYASEVDSFNGRYGQLPDSLDVLNNKANELFQGALAKANKRGKCKDKRLYRKLRKVFNNHYLGSFTKFVIKSDQVKRIVTPVTESIYRDFDAFIPGFFARHVQDPSGDLLKVGGHFIGTDKFEHFSGSGYKYFKSYYLDKKPLKEVLNIGWKAETGYLGAVTTGVMSYADMAANFTGMRFWNHIQQKFDDVLGAKYNIGPYVVCRDNKWEQVKAINWTDYIDDAFDEGTNCNKYRTRSMREQVDYHVIELEKDGNQYECPIVKNSLAPLREKYGVLSDSLLNFRRDFSVQEENDNQELIDRLNQVNETINTIQMINK